MRFRASYFAMLAVFILLAIAVDAPATGAQGYDPYLSPPSRIPRFDNYRTPIIKPGDSDTLRFNVTNRYLEPIVNTTLYIEIYMYATIEESKPVGRVSHPPRLVGCSYTDWEETDNGLVIHMGVLTPNLNTTVSVEIKTSSNTPEGTYFVRSMMVFDIGNTTGVVMKSRGYFTSEEWDRATSDRDASPVGINLTALNCTGIIPDTSFSVRDPWPLWKTVSLAFLVIAIIITGGLAILFYLTDEMGYFPDLKEKLDALGRKDREKKKT